MPTYDYKCNACSHTFEHFQSMKDAPLKKCPKCGKNKLERLIGTGAAVIFKGSGFYQTDYRSEGYKKAADADKPAESSGGGGDASKSSADSKPDTKPAAKSDSKTAAKDTSTKPGKPAATKADHAPKEKPKASTKGPGS